MTERPEKPGQYKLLVHLGWMNPLKYFLELYLHRYAVTLSLQRRRGAGK